MNFGTVYSYFRMDPTVENTVDGTMVCDINLFSRLSLLAESKMVRSNSSCRLDRYNAIFENVLVFCRRMSVLANKTSLKRMIVMRVATMMNWGAVEAMNVMYIVIKSHFPFTICYFFWFYSSRGATLHKNCIEHSLKSP